MDATNICLYDVSIFLMISTMQTCFDAKDVEDDDVLLMILMMLMMMHLSKEGNVSSLLR